MSPGGSHTMGRPAKEMSGMSGEGFDDADGGQVDRLIKASHLPSMGENMITAECDEEGRIQLGPQVRQRYGRRFFVLEAPGELVLLPVAEDPVKDLQEIGRSLRGLSVEDLKRRIDEQADKEVEETLNRLGMRRIALEPEHSGTGLVDEHKQ